MAASKNQAVESTPPDDQGSSPQMRLLRPDPTRGDKKDWTLPKPPALANGPDATALWKGFCRRWPLALILGVLVAGAAFAAVWLLLPERYKGFALLQISSTRPTLGLEGEARNDFQTYLKTQAARIKSRDVLMKALNQDAVRNLRLVQKHPDTLSTLAWLEEHLKVETQDGSEIMELGLFGEDPNELTVMVGALTKSYLSIIGSHEKGLRKDRVGKMKMLHEQAKLQLSEKVAAREAIMNGAGAKDPAAMISKQQSVQAQLSKALDQHQLIGFELMRRDLQMQALVAGKKKAETFALPDTAIKEIQDSDPILRQDLATLKQIEKTLDRLEAEGHPPTDFTVKQMKGNAARVRGQVDERTKELLAEHERRIKVKADAEYEIAMDDLKLVLLPLQAQKKLLDDKVDKLTKESEAVNIETAKKQLLDGEIDQLDANVASLHKALNKLLVEEESESRVNPVGEAEWQKLSSKKRIFLLLLAPLAGFVLVAFGLAWLESNARRITSAEEVASGLALRVVGTVPVLPQAGGTQEQGHNLVESIDAIRTMLLRSARSDLTRIVMVTSAVSGEGKTTLASNLAVSLAKVGKKTLLLDCDLRGPAVHQLFEQQLQPGFSEAILGEVPLQDTLRQTNDPNLWIMPAGHWDREVVQELAKTGLESMFERLKEEFDFVLVDSHPILAANDALVIGQQVDAVILSLMRDLSQAANVYTACQKLASLGIEVFGTVINGVPVKDFNKGKYTTPAQEAPAAASA